MPPFPNPNEKAAAVTICDGLDFVLGTLTVQPPGKDRTHVHYHILRAPRNPA